MNPHTYTCLAGDNTSGLTAAINASGDVKIQGTTCSISGSFQPPSNKNIQCASLGTTLLFNNTDGNTRMFNLDNRQNVSISGCTFDGPTPFPYGWDAKLSNSNYTSFNFYIFIPNNSGQPSNILITGNRFLHVRAQAAVEAYANASVARPTGIHIDFNDAVGCGLYGFNFDNVQNSTINNNFASDCIIGPELDGAGQAVPNVQINGNHVERTTNSTGWGHECMIGLPNQSGCAQYFSGLTCGTVQESVADYSGCTAANNFCTGNGFPTNIYIGTHNGASLSGNYTNNTFGSGCSYQQR